GPPTRRALISFFTLTIADRPGQTFTLSARGMCAVSSEGDRIVFLDSTGMARLWELEPARELASRPAPDARQFLFTGHGVAIVRSGTVQLFGGPDGDVTIQLPPREATPILPQDSRDGAVSSDGHLIALASVTSNQVDVIDLQDRVVLASVSYPPGRPRLTLSPDGARLLVAGLAESSVILGWELTRGSPLASGTGRSFRLNPSGNGRRFLLTEHRSEDVHYELWESQGRLIRSATAPRMKQNEISGDGSRIVIAEPDLVQLVDADSGRILEQVDCKGCRQLRLSLDGTRLLAKSPSFIALGKLDPPALLWSESQRAGALRNSMSLSGDGKTASWVWNGRVLLRDDTASGGSELSEEQEILDAALDRGGTAMA